MLVVSDTSPITALLAIDRFDILESLYGAIVVPSAVERELLGYHETLPGSIQVRAPANVEEVQRLRLDLDEGEAEAIVLAGELHADFLLMDEALGRERARAAHLSVIGLVGVLLVAKRHGLIISMADTLMQLQDRAGFYLSERVVRLALEQAGE